MLRINPAIRAYFLQIRRSVNIIVQIENHNHLRKQRCKSSKDKLVKISDDVQ